MTIIVCSSFGIALILTILKSLDSIARAFCLKSARLSSSKKHFISRGSHLVDLSDGSDTYKIFQSASRILSVWSTCYHRDRHAEQMFTILSVITLAGYIQVHHLSMPKHQISCIQFLRPCRNSSTRTCTQSVRRKNQCVACNTFICKVTPERVVQ